MPTLLPYANAHLDEIESQRQLLTHTAHCVAVKYGRQDKRTMAILRIAVSDAGQLAAQTGDHSDDATWYRLATLLATERGLVQP